MICLRHYRGLVTLFLEFTLLHTHIYIYIYIQIYIYIYKYIYICSSVNSIHIIHIIHIWGRIQDIEFEQLGLPLPIHCMGKPFKVSTNYYVFSCFVVFFLQRATFCFCLFFKLSLATTTGVDACLCLSFDII